LKMASHRYLADNVVATITKHSMLSGGEKVLVGLSGGPDSVCLLSVLHSIRERFTLQISAAYIDHGLRPHETGKEIEFCRNLCERLNVPFYTKAIDVKSYAEDRKMNMQEAARQLRYGAFEAISHDIGAGKIALGHTADDQAETLLMRLFRGSGPTGLSGIPPVKKNVIRPLIETGRGEIEKFLEDEKTEYITDSSNLKKNYLRNRIRLSFVPMLREYNPDIIETLSRTAAIFRDEERYFEIIATKALMKLISRKTDSRIELFLAPLEIMDKAIMRRVLRRVIDETKGLRGISFIHIEDIIDLIKSGGSGDRIYLPKGIRVIKEYSVLILTSETPVKLGTYSLTVPGEVILKEAGILIKSSLTTAHELQTQGLNKELRTASGVFDADKLKYPLTVRPRKDGDFFYPAGFGRRKKIQDFFVDEKVPRDERDRVPLLVSGNDIIWVAGYRGDDRFKVGEGTDKVVRFEVKKIRD
jgi:tRNA(Ile)-lysidine synthase